jgi:hypothetical protein
MTESVGNNEISQIWNLPLKIFVIVHCAAKLSHKVKINRSFLYFTSSAISLC